jgi:hypothetical protein
MEAALRGRIMSMPPVRARRHRARRVLVASILAIALVVGGAVAIHRLSGAGPALANTLRSVLGKDAVARLEELAAAVEDRVLRTVRGRSRPRALSELAPPAVPNAGQPSSPAPSASVTTPAAADDSAVGSSAPGKASETGMSDTASPEPPSRTVAWLPPAITPPFPEVAAVDDGRWLAVADPARPDAEPLIYETLLHPDPERTYSELFLTVMPAARVRVQVVAGTVEPETLNPAAAELPYRGLIPPDDIDQLLAAFNGAFRAVHGHHGMLVDGVLLLPPRPEMCTVAGYADGSLRVGTFARLVTLPAEPEWYRQTPPCMIESGRLHPGLENPAARTWGATLEGETVIRRSAIGLSRGGDRIYVAVTNYTTARALALGLHAAGAHDVAQLDVNWSYPVFLLFPADDTGERHADSLFPGFFFDRDEKLRKPSARDFFYVMRSGEVADASATASDAGVDERAARAMRAEP